jgi:HEAT repeat protein
MSEQYSGETLRKKAELLSSPDEETRRSTVVELSALPLRATREHLYRAMGDPSWRVRKEAVEVFLSSPAAVEFTKEVFELLRSQENAGLRNSAAETLVRMGKATLPVLEAHRDDDDGDVRKFVIDIMGSIGDASSCPLLIQALDDDDPNVRTSAAESLGRMKDSRAVQPLLDALSLPDITFRYTILDALAGIGVPFSLGAITPFLEDSLLRKAVYECLGSVGGCDAVPLLVEGLSEGGRSVRESAAKAFMEIRGRISPDRVEPESDSVVRTLAGTPAVDGLLAILESPDPGLQKAIVGILGIIGDGRAAPAILRACRHERLLPDCLCALRLMGTITLPFLEQEFSAGDEEEKTNILRLCGEMEMRQAPALVRKGMEDPAPQVREAAARAVGKICLPELIAETSALLNDFDQEVRDAALEALTVLSGTDAPSVTEVAAALVTAADPDKRRYAAFLCGVLRDGERLALLMKDEDGRVRKAAVQGLAEFDGDDAVHHLILALTDENPEVRIAAADSLGETTREDALGALALAARDEDPWVRCAALRSLGKAGGVHALPEIESALDHADGLLSLAALEALDRIQGKKSLELIRRAASGKDGDVVKAAMEILARRGDPWLVEQGEMLLRHPQWDVRGTAVRILVERWGAEAVPLLRHQLEMESDDLVRSRIVDFLKRFP